MKKFVAVFTGSTAARERSGWDNLNDADRAAREQKGMAAWGAWIEKNKGAIVDNGAPLGKTKRDTTSHSSFTRAGTMGSSSRV